MGATFVGLRIADEGHPAGFVLTLRIRPRPDEEIEAETAADAYALGVLARIAAANELLAPPPLDAQITGNAGIRSGPARIGSKRARSSPSDPDVARQDPDQSAGCARRADLPRRHRHPRDRRGREASDLGDVHGVGQHVRSVKVGDRVLFSPDDQYEVEVGGDTYLVLRERDLQAVASEAAVGSVGCISRQADQHLRGRAGRRPRIDRAGRPADQFRVTSRQLSTPLSASRSGMDKDGGRHPLRVPDLRVIAADASARVRQLEGNECPMDHFDLIVIGSDRRGRKRPSPPRNSASAPRSSNDGT